jgi:photosystem II stability/assembly factor-like uncharacterized protein
MKHTSHTRAVRILSDLFYFFSIFIFINAFNFQHNPPGAWRPQFIENMSGRYLPDMMFVDSLVGYSVSNNQGPGINYVFKTTNGGDNWMQVFETSWDPARVFFLNRDTGFINGGNKLYRTKNGGGDWEEIFTPPSFELYDFAAISIDTIIISTSYIEGESIWRTENGGNLWVRRYTGTTVQKLYMYDNRLGFAGDAATTFFMRTSNSGINWTRIEGQRGFEDIEFSDSLFGWKSRTWDDDSLRKTTDGGLTWAVKDIPRGPPISFYGGMLYKYPLGRFDLMNKDTIWGPGSFIAYFDTQRLKGVLYRSTDRGENWQLQIPDTGLFRKTHWKLIDFVDRQNGWVYGVDSVGVNTKVGGDTIFYTLTGISNTGSEHVMKYSLNQNYPNPFNPKTRISYDLKTSGYISLVISNSLGKRITSLVNQRQNSGNYEIEFDGSNLPSSVYFYSLFINGERIETRKMLLTK